MNRYAVNISVSCDGKTAHHRDEVEAADIGDVIDNADDGAIDAMMERVNPGEDADVGSFNLSMSIMRIGRVKGPLVVRGGSRVA